MVKLFNHSDPENIHSHPKEVPRKFHGEGDLKRQTFLKERMTMQWNFQRH